MVAIEAFPPATSRSDLIGPRLQNLQFF